MQLPNRAAPSSFDDILTKTDIVELINEVTPLTKRGKNHFGLCPFHQEKTPSFSVSEDKGLYHCFSCKASGNALTFVKETKGFSTSEAVKYLADRAGVDVDMGRFKDPNEKYYDINREAMNYYHVMLTHSSAGDAARKYLKKRGIEETTITTFDIGVALDTQDGLFSALKKKDVLESDMTDLGLVRIDDVSARDIFRKRIIFPIHDEHGRVVAFSGRTYLKDETSAKYINSPQTPVFVKSRVLYNLHRVKKTAKEKGRIVIFEGFMDVFAAHQAGIAEGVATMGTALTSEHIAKIKTVTDKVVLCFDADRAGKDATRTFIKDLTRAGLETSVAGLDEGKDPDDIIREQGKDVFVRAIEHALNYKDYLYADHLQDIDRTKITEVEAFKKRVFTLITPLSNVERAHYLSRMSEDLKLSRETLEADFKALRVKEHPRYRKIPKIEITDKFKKTERQLIRYFLKDRYYEKKFRSEFNDVLFNDKHARDIQLEIFEYYRLHPHDLCIVPELFINGLPENLKAYYEAHINDAKLPHDDEEYEDFLIVMREQNRRYAINVLQKKIEQTDSIDEKIAYRKKIDTLIREAANGQRKNHPRTD